MASSFMPSTYKESLSTGVYGFYYNMNQEQKEQNVVSSQKRYLYFPSISNGIFGTWQYNESSPYQMSEIKPIQTTTKPKKLKRNLLKTSYGYGQQSDESTENYNFIIRGPRAEPIKDGKRYNVKLLQEFTLPTGKSLKNYLKQNQKNDINGNGKLYICEGSVVHFSGECIINAANEGMLGGGGVDGAISSAGGDSLYYLREREPTLKGSKFVRCRTGDAKITQSGYPYNRLKCDYVIHAVGPNYSMLLRGKKQMQIADIDQLLYSSYAKSMLICRERGIKSVGFCLISAGIFRGPRSLEDVLKFGIMAIRDYMFPGIEVYLIGYTNSELCTLTEVAPKVLKGDAKEYREYAKVEKEQTWGSSISSMLSSSIGGFSWGSKGKKTNKKNKKKSGK